METNWLKDFNDKDLLRYRQNIKREARSEPRYQTLLHEIDNELSARLDNRPCLITHATINLEYIGHGGGDTIYQCPMCKEIIRMP